MTLTAEMQTPSQSVPLTLEPPMYPPSNSTTTTNPFPSPATSLQKILSFDLKEEGQHVLAINVSYTETLGSSTSPTPASSSPSQPASNRTRSFRKLYQFLAQPCLSVRTKASQLPSSSSHPPLLRFALEAQLENVSDLPITITATNLTARPPLSSKPLNWDTFPASALNEPHPPLLAPRDVIQVLFLIEQLPDVAEGMEALKTGVQREGRATLGQLAIEWRGAMGEKGVLVTGGLMSRRTVL